MIRRTYLPRLGLILSLGLAISLGGCSKFFPLDDDAADGTTGPDGTTGDADVAGDDGGPTADDGGLEPDDFIPPPDDGDQGPDADTDVPDVPDVPDIPDVPCNPTCPTIDERRCVEAEAEGEFDRVEVCALDANDCLHWQPVEECSPPSDDKCVLSRACGTDEETELLTCVPDEVLICPDSGDPCIPNQCKPTTGTCVPAALAPLELCDDGDPCTTLETCNVQLKCVGNWDADLCGPCTTDEQCEADYGDGNFCNGRYVCADGPGGKTGCQLDPEPLPCPANPDFCLKNVCDAVLGSCVAVPDKETQPCGQDNMCWNAAFCTAGVCTPTDQVECTEAGECEEGVCDPGTGSCSYGPAPSCCGDGTPQLAEQCDDDGTDDGDGCDADCALEGCAELSAEFVLDDKACLYIPGDDVLSAGATSFTIEMWLDPSTVGQDGTLIDREISPESGDLDWTLRFTSEIDGTQFAQPLWTEGRVGMADAEAIGPQNMAPGWQHLAMTRTLESGTATIEWYLDGEPAGTPTVIESAGDLASTEPLYVGCRENGQGGWYEGRIDELHISNVVAYTGSFTPPSEPLVADDASEALYHFDETTLGVAADASGNAHPATWLGAKPSLNNAFGADETFTASCEVTVCNRHSLDLDPATGTGTRVQKTDALDGVQSLTVEFFFRADTVAAATVLSRSSTTPGEPDWHIDLVGEPGVPRLRWVEPVAGADTFVPSPAITGNVWYHVAVTRSFDQASGSLTIQWFLNGDADAPVILAGGEPLMSSGPLHFGSLSGGFGFNGGLDEVRISEGVLYTGDFPIPGALLQRADTLGLWRFDEGEGPGSTSEIFTPLGAVRFEEGASFSNGVAPALDGCN